MLEALENLPAAGQWERIGVRHHHGVDIALFSLKSAESLGIGEYLDLLPVLRWCREVGFGVIQLLPINDTGLDCSPYNALSANALNPNYLSLRALDGFEESEETRTLAELNMLQRIDHEKVRELKAQFLRDYFLKNKGRIVGTEPFQKFAASHPWLKEYALFKALKVGNEWKSWTLWDEEIRTPDKETLERLAVEHSEEVLFHTFVQFLCFSQFKEVHREAKRLGLTLMGDIPILISPDSNDVWAHQELFDLNWAAGAPPDMYNEDGQYWGFPLYRWPAHEKEGFAWWRERLSTAKDLYDIFRIDHVVGFFRIWAIPHGQPALYGHYVPELPMEWLDQGRHLIATLQQSTSMLPIGEDLGMVPDEVRAILTQMGIPGTKVMRWVKSWQGRMTFTPPSEYPPLSLTTVSTHDSDTLGQWWLKEPHESQEWAALCGWEWEPELSFERRLELLRQSHTSGSLFHINLIGEYLALFPELVWANPGDERINIPGTQSDHNWSIRMKASLEEWTEHPLLKQTVRSKILP